MEILNNIVKRMHEDRESMAILKKYTGKPEYNKSFMEGFDCAIKRLEVNIRDITSYAILSTDSDEN